MATYNWAGTLTTAWGTAGNWVDQATGLAALAAPTAAEVCRFGTGTGATNNNCATAAGDVCRELQVNNAYTGTLTLANSTTALAVGDGSGGAVTIGTGMTLAAAGTSSRLNLASSSTNSGAGWPITTNAITLPFSLTSTGSGRWTLQDDLTISLNSGNALRIAAGTFDCNNKNVTISGANGTLVVIGGTLITGTGTFTYGTTATLSFFQYSSGTVTGGSEVHNLTGTGNNVRTFAGGGQSYGALQHNAASGTGSLTVTGANTFTFLACLSGRTLTLPASTTTTVSGANGLGGRPGGIGGIKGTLKSSTAATAATISLTSAVVSIMRGPTIQDITVTPAGHAYALDGAVSTSGNTGITFGGIAPGWGVAV